MAKRFQNEGKLDRSIRLFLGVVLVFMTTSYTVGLMQITLYFVAFILIVTSFSGVCLAYKACRINTK